MCDEHNPAHLKRHCNGSLLFRFEVSVSGVTNSKRLLLPPSQAANTQKLPALSMRALLPIDRPSAVEIACTTCPPAESHTLRRDA